MRGIWSYDEMRDLALSRRASVIAAGFISVSGRVGGERIGLCAASPMDAGMVGR